MLEVCKTITFDGAHRLPKTPRGHKCHGLHGHTWHLRVWMTGAVDPATGWIIDFHEADAIIRENATDRLDHRLMNDVIPNPTTENLAIWIHAAIAPRLEAVGVRVTRIEIQEGADCWCTLTP